jgi:linearmycin/streptolysin S transport system permease protein
MIGTLLRIGFINLRRDRVAQALTFLLPVLFFSIFAAMFGNQANRGSTKTRVVVVDEDGSDYSKRLVTALSSEGPLAVQTTVERDGSGGPATRQAAEALVRDGTLSVAVVLPKGLGEHHVAWGQRGGPSVEVLTDIADPIASQVVSGLLQKVSFTSATANTTGASGTQFGLPIEMVNVVQPKAGQLATISFSAAGIGVMFLLFSASGAGGSLLDEEESGTLGRLIGSRAGMRGVLAGKWIFLSLMGVLQLTVMFAWGALVFHLPLASHLPGFYVMTVFTAMAAAGFGLVLATLSRSRAQLSGISTIVILTMSALGGSMFPRFLMSETMQKFGLVTFNAWALDGYLKVFWREAPIRDLWPQVLVLSGLTVVFLALARVFARRWERL